MNSTCMPSELPCNQIDGDTRQIQFSPEYVMQMYLSTSTRHQRNILTENFFSYNNIFMILRVLENMLTKYIGEPVRIPFNDEFVQTMWEVASQNTGLTNVPGAVAILNKAVIDHEFNVHSNSLLHRKLWIKYYIKQDRMRVMPYGELTKQTKGDDVISTSSYSLSHPFQRYRAEALLHGNGMCRDANGNYSNIPGFLQVKVPNIPECNDTLQ